MGAKTKLSILSFLLSASLFASPPPLPVLLITPDSTVAPSDGTLTLTWGTNNPPSTNFSVTIVQVTNLVLTQTLPLTNWTFVTNFPGNRTSITLTNDGFDHFYAGWLTNARGIIPFTNSVLHPGLLQADFLSGKRGI